MRAAPAQQHPRDLELDLARELEALLQPERQVQPPLPRVTSVRLVNTGSTHPDNCVPMDLGVGIGGTATNGIELQFTISGHRAGVEHDITRTRRNSLWQRRAGVWAGLEYQPMGTGDDRHDGDECLRPRNGRIFAVDAPGWATLLPMPDGAIWPGATGVGSHADADDVVLRASFAEWVIARSRGEGIPWTPISPGPFVFWHTITWLTRNAAREWVLDGARSRIGPGALSAAAVNSAPR